MIADRDKRLGITSEEKRKNREDLPAPAISAGADAWQKGESMQLSLRPLPKGSPVPHASHAPLQAVSSGGTAEAPKAK